MGLGFGVKKNFGSICTHCPERAQLDVGVSTLGKQPQGMMEMSMIPQLFAEINFPKCRMTGCTKRKLAFRPPALSFDPEAGTSKLPDNC